MIYLLYCLWRIRRGMWDLSDIKFEEGTIVWKV